MRATEPMQDVKARQSKYGSVLCQSLCIARHSKWNSNVRTFGICLVPGCQEEFEGSNRYAHLSGTQVLKARQRMLGNVRFIGHLFLAHMLGESITMNCVQNLLPRSAVDSNGDRIESLCTLLQVCGKELDSLPSCHAAMESVFEQVRKRACARRGRDCVMHWFLRNAGRRMVIKIVVGSFLTARRSTACPIAGS